MYYPVIYTGLADLREAIRDDFEADDYRFLSTDSPEAEATIAEGEYATITYNGGDTATIADFPVVNPITIILPISPTGTIHGTLAAELIRAHLEYSGAIAPIEARVTQYRQTGTA
ncbi:hypothetical protein [Glycomyces sp. NPDC021274]|uniref:hypothetical protein n=1 Tax=Glycomyces sp. NPDC021274 TaxID=3155120 RepID=UPI0033EA1348